jgi:hypothetical protein
MKKENLKTFMEMAILVIKKPSRIRSLSWLSTPSLTSWDAGEPWWSSPAIDYLSRRLHPGDRVFEWGSGGSTVWLIERGANVTSIEHDSDWMSRVLDRCPDADLRLVRGSDQGTLQNPGGIYFFDDYVAAIDGEPDKSIDVVIVDGMCRLDCLQRAISKIKPGGILILDDTENPMNDPGGIEGISGWELVRKDGFVRTYPAPTETTFWTCPRQ